MQREAAWRIEEARAVRPFTSVHDLALRADLASEHLKLLASAGALESFSGNRRQALWVASGSAPDRGLLRVAEIEEDELTLAVPSEAENLVADYRHLGLTLGRHPLTFLRDHLQKRRYVRSDVLNVYGDGRPACGAGLVTVRQRPETASGTVFITLEDETGNVNVIVGARSMAIQEWRKAFSRNPARRPKPSAG